MTFIPPATYIPCNYDNASTYSYNTATTTTIPNYTPITISRPNPINSAAMNYIYNPEYVTTGTTNYTYPINTYPITIMPTYPIQYLNLDFNKIAGFEKLAEIKNDEFLSKISPIEKKPGQRWMFESSEFKYIVEIISGSHQLNHTKCKVIQVMKGGALIGAVCDWILDYGWIYLEGQDKQ